MVATLLYDKLYGNYSFVTHNNRLFAHTSFPNVKPVHKGVFIVMESGWYYYCLLLFDLILRMVSPQMINECGLVSQSPAPQLSHLCDVTEGIKACANAFFVLLQAGYLRSNI